MQYIKQIIGSTQGTSNANTFFLKKNQDFQYWTYTKCLNRPYIYGRILK